jgi:hypothetical protein
MLMHPTSNFKLLGGEAQQINIPIAEQTSN